MDIDITITPPVLVGTQYFNVRYKLQSDTLWTDISPQTNALFTISGLSEGDYDLGVTLAEGTSPEQLCDETFYTFHVGSEETCLDYTVGFFEDRGAIFIELGVSPLSPAPNICGIQVVWFPNSNPNAQQQAVYAPPFSTPYYLPASAEDYTIQIYEQLCDGTIQLCDELEALYSESGCTPADYGDTFMTYENGVYYITIGINSQSSPYTDPFQINYGQDNLVYSGQPEQGQTIYLNATPSTTSLVFPVNPNEDVVPQNGNRRIVYKFNVIDFCQNIEKFSVFYDIT